MKQALSFDDVLLVPQYSEIASRKDVSLKVHLSKGLKVEFPVIPSNMKDIAGFDLMSKFYENKAMILAHRFNSIADQLNLLQQLIEKHGNDVCNYFGFSVGVKPEDYENLEILAPHTKIICIDVAHGDSLACINMVKYISDKYPHIFLIAGNVATSQGAIRLWEAGADGIKAGIGGSAVCTTRNVSGNGYPQLGMLMEIWPEKLKLESKLDKNLFLISDGGCRIEADFVKSLCFSDLTMAGFYFAASNEAPGTRTEKDGKTYKRYDGSSTLKDRVEGVRSLVETKGPVQGLIDKVKKGLQSACSYQGTRNLLELKDNPQFIRLTQAGIVESYPHDVMVIK